MEDVAYWLAPGTRRFIDEDSSTATIGFRCAMTSASSDYSKDSAITLHKLDLYKQIKKANQRFNPIW